MQNLDVLPVASMKGCLEQITPGEAYKSKWPAVKITV